jgi:hypothetical protein
MCSRVARVGTRASFDAEQRNRHQTHRRSHSARMPNIRRARASTLPAHPDTRSRGECSAMCGGSIRQSVGPLGREISPAQDRYLHRTTKTQNKRRQTSKPQMGFEPVIPAFERAKTYALDHAATVIGVLLLQGLYLVSNDFKVHMKYFLLAR